MATPQSEVKSEKKKVARRETRKIKDKWKAKAWYTIRAPKMFNLVPVAETLADEQPKLLDRIAETTLQDLTGDFTKMHVKLYFKVNGVKGTDCTTKYVGHELTSDYIRRLTRRKHSKVDGVVDVTTKDGWSFRVKSMAITERRAQSSQETTIRHITERVVSQAAGTQDVAAFVKGVVNGDLAQAIFTEARKVYPLKRVEIRKSQVTGEPAGWVEEIDAFPTAAEAGAAPAEGAESAEADAVSEALAGESKESSEEELTEEERVNE